MAPWWPRAGHGTEARHRRHYREGTPPCLECRLAHSQYRAGYVRPSRAKVLLPAVIPVTGTAAAPGASQ